MQKQKRYAIFISNSIFHFNFSCLGYNYNFNLKEAKQEAAKLNFQI